MKVLAVVILICMVIANMAMALRYYRYAKMIQCKEECTVTLEKSDKKENDATEYHREHR